MKKTLILLSLTVLVITVYSQKPPIKFGKIDLEDLTNFVYEEDTSASAVVLCDYGNTYFNYTSTRGFHFVFDRICRIKVLKKDGYKYADFSVTVYNSDGDSEEKVGDIKGFTFNFEDNSIIKSKLDRKGIFKEKIDDKRTRIKFSMPNVKEGSIIDVQYQITSNYWYNYKNWYFQRDIPVKWSEYNVSIPEYFKYKKLFKGYIPLSINEEKTKVGSFNVYIDHIWDDKRKNEFQTYNVELNCNRWVAENIPAFIEEPYSLSDENYISKIEFELNSTHFPNSSTQLYSESWEIITNKLLISGRFGYRLDEKSVVKDIAKNINSKYTDPLQKIIAAHEYVKNNIKWNGYNGIYTDKNMYEVLYEKSGNVSEVNLFLTLLLRGVGLDAYPVISSTRSNGLLNIIYPMVSDFNYVLSYVKLDDQVYILDATEKYLPYNILPKRCLNDKGRIISKEIQDWVVLETKTPNVITWSYELVLTDDFMLKGKATNIKKDYAAFDFRKLYHNESDKEEIIKNIESGNVGLNIVDYSYENIDSLNKPVRSEFEIEIEDKITEAGNLVFFNPMLYEEISENPFKLENRQYPVDYAYPHNTTYILKLQLPEGYEIEEVPENIQIVLPNKSAMFVYNITQMNGFIHVISRFYINKSVFMPEEYTGLKEFYNQVVAKHNEQIVLKKL